MAWRKLPKLVAVKKKPTASMVIGNVVGPNRCYQCWYILAGLGAGCGVLEVNLKTGKCSFNNQQVFVDKMIDNPIVELKTDDTTVSPCKLFKRPSPLSAVHSNRHRHSTVLPPGVAAPPLAERDGLGLFGGLRPLLPVSCFGSLPIQMPQPPPSDG